VVAQAADTAHDGIEVPHLERDVIERAQPCARERRAVVRLVAADEHHALGAVRHAEAEYAFGHLRGGFRVRRIEHHVRQLHGQVTAFDRCDVRRVG
jgi:hypothetical protein